MAEKRSSLKDIMQQQQQQQQQLQQQKGCQIEVQKGGPKYIYLRPGM